MSDGAEHIVASDEDQDLAPEIHNMADGSAATIDAVGSHGDAIDIDPIDRDAVIDADAAHGGDGFIDLDAQRPDEEPLVSAEPESSEYVAAVDAAIIMPPADDSSAPEPEQTTHVGDVPQDEPVLHLASLDVVHDATPSGDEPPAAVAPPDDFRFPWTRDSSEPPAAVHAVTDSVPVEPAADALVSTYEHAAETPPKAKAPGFFARMFGRKSKDLPTEPLTATVAETEVEAPAVDAVAMEAPLLEEPSVEPEPLPEVSFTSVDEALPTDDVALAVADEAVMEAPPARPPAKPGFFARLFGRRAADSVDLEEDAAIEVHEDRIEAAAHALDQVGEEQFESFEGRTSGASDAAFAGIEDALPADDALPAVQEALPANDAFEPAELPAVVDDLPLVPLEPESPPRVSDEELRFAPPSNDLPLIEELAPAAASEVAEMGARITAEVPVTDVPDVPEAELAAPSEVTEEEVAGAFDGTSTQEIEEKTDEFAIVTPEMVADTLEGEKKSWTTSLLRLFRRGDTVIEKVAEKEEEKEQPHFLLSKFRAFYNEIIRFQHQKSEFTAGFATAIVTDYAADISPDAAAEGLSKRLSELLELQAAEAKWMGGEAGERYPDAQYAMAALADETFAHMEWEGQPSWPKYSIERKLHQTNSADVEIFRRIDKLLKDSPDSDIARDLARVYLLVLAAGFQGKWRPFELLRPIAEYRRRLYEYVHGADPLMLYAPERKVFPEAASRTLEGLAVARFSAIQRWIAILVFLVVSYTVIAHVAWSRVSADLKDVTVRIKSGSAAGVQ